MIMPRVGLVLLNLVLVAWTFPSIAETYYVRPDGDDQAEGKSPQTAFKTLLRAAHVLNHGDAVLLAPGTYHDEVLLAERFSADGAEMQITGDESGQRTAAPPGPVVIRAENSTGTALEIQRFRNLRISGLTFRGPGQGLKVQRSSGVVVQRCSFEGLSRGLALGQCQDVRVESSVFSRCTLGVFCQSAVRTRLAHLTVSGASSAGILVLSSGEGAIRNSLLTGNNTNLIADEISGPAWTSDHNVLEGSTGPWGGVPVIAKVYEWASASGQDRHSVYVMPAFQDPDSYDLHPAATVTWAGGLPGARVGQVLDPKVELDRDGRPLTVREGAVCAGAYDYPAEPQPGAGWRRLEVNLRGQGPRQSAA
ncbi:MAG: right-handed parallel beta-helix repeat-containing protein, partial [Thermoguttaceae bacterium]